MAGSDKKKCERLLEIADENDSPINDWERDFLNSVWSHRISIGTPLSEKQQRIFDRIANEHLDDESSDDERPSRGGLDSRSGSRDEDIPF